MTELVIPSIGSSGFFELRPPFDQVVLRNEQYTCQGIRKISEYLASNEDVKALVYDANAIDESDYNADAEADMPIVSLQADIGHWVYVPARYIIKYPITNGVPYRTLMIGISLPPMPVERDLTFLTTDLSNLVRDSLGVDVEIKLVETSKIVLVPRTKHNLELSDRYAVSNGRTTDRSRYMSTQVQLDAALAKIAELETYIANNIPTPVV